MLMPKRIFKTASARRAVAILGVDNLTLSDFGYDVLKQVENGVITHEQAKDAILSRAKAKANAANVTGHEERADGRRIGFDDTPGRLPADFLTMKTAE